MSEDFFGIFEEKRHGHNKHDRSQWNHDLHDDRLHEDHDRKGSHRDSGHDDFNITLLKSYGEKILKNKLLMAGILIFALFCVIGFIALVILFFPVILKISNLILNNGLKGVLDTIQPILNALLQGSGK
jgi:hypothetical protein